jgi:imidazolonepropionase-like amidohydrolase
LVSDTGPDDVILRQLVNGQGMSPRPTAAMIEPLGLRPGPVLLRDARVLDLDTGALSAPRNVLVEGPRILDLDPGLPKPGWAVLPCEGHTLMPGLIDCHAHILSFFGTGEERMAPAANLRQLRRNLRATLASGVVCVRDLLSPLGVLDLVRWRIARGRIPGPRILRAGPILTCPGGYPEYIQPVGRSLARISGQLKLELDSPEAAVAAVHSLAKRGVDLIKLGYSSTSTWFDQDAPLPVMPESTIAAICEAAHGHGLPVAMHHSDGGDLAVALRAPIDSLEHVMFDRVMTQDEARALASSGIVSVPTMVVQHSLVRFEDKLDFLRSPRATELFEPMVLARLRLIAAQYRTARPDFDDRVLGWTRGNRTALRDITTSLERMVAAGVPMCAGTDLGALVVFPGELPDELLLLEAGGLPRLEVLRAATTYAAKLLGLEGELGAVRPGWAADLVLVDGDPTADLHAMKRPRLVGCGGRWYRPTHPETPDFWGERGVVSRG